MSDLSLHIDCTYRWQQAQVFLASTHVHSAFLMNASAEQVQYALQHCDFVVVRIYDPFNERNALGEDFEKSIVNRRPGSDFVHWLNNSLFVQFKGNNKVRFVLGWNELYSKRGNAEREQNTRIVAIATALVNAGYGVGLGAWAADKSFYADDVEAGHWDNVIRFAVAHKDMVSIDCHEYDVLTPFAGHLLNYPDGFPNTLKNPVSLDSANHARIPYTKAEGNIETNYKMGRIALLLQRALDLTGDVFNWYRGECAHDYKDDGSLKQFIDEWYKPRFGHPTGINSLQDYYRHLLGSDLTENAYDETLFKQYTDLCEGDPPSCQANFIFAWNGDRIRWLPFDVAQRPYFVSLVANYESSQEPQPMPYTMEPKIISSKNQTNIRKTPFASGALFLTLNASSQDTLEALVSNVPVENNDGFEWYRIEYQNEVYYVAKTNNLVLSDPPVIDPPDTGNETPTDAQWQALIDGIKAVQAKQLEMDARIAEIETKVSAVTSARLIDFIVGDLTFSAYEHQLPMIASLARIVKYGATELEKQTRRANGELLADDLAAQGYSTTVDDDNQAFLDALNERGTTVTPEPELDVHTNVSLGIGDAELLSNMERTITDIMMNEDTDSAEDGNAA